MYLRKLLLWEIKGLDKLFGRFERRRVSYIFELAVIANRHQVTFKEDIKEKIAADFGESSKQAFDVLKNAIEKTEYLKTDRVIRCIIFLSKGNIEDLKKYIDAATFDTRDVMLWAEYEKLNGDLNYKRRRDFNKTFEESTNDVKE